MDKLNFIDSLDEEQSENAIKVARMARESGVDPNLAVAIAFKEGGLRTNAPRGSSGEIGMMQVMPKTGKSLGYDEKKLSIPNQNIKAGIEYLKLGLQATENDPQLAAIFYNGGPGAVDALKSGKEPDSRVFDYVRSLSSYGAFEAGAASGAETEGGDMVPGKAPPPKPPEPDTSGASRAEQFLFGGIGAGAGALASAGQGVSDVRTGMAATRAGAEETARIAAQRAAGVSAAPAAAPAAPAVAPGAQAPMRQPAIPAGGNLQPPMGPADAGRMARGQTGAGTYNYAKDTGLTDIEAGRALDTTKQKGGVHDLLTQRREAMNTIQNMPGDRYVENPRFGGLLTTDQSAGRGPRESFSMKPVVPPSPDLPLGEPGGLSKLSPRQPVSTAPMLPKGPSGLDAVTDMFKTMMRPLKPVVNAARIAGKYAFPPMAGLAAGLEAADVAHEYDKPEVQRDYTKMGLQAATALGGGLSMFKPTAPLGIPLATGAAAAQAYREDPEIFNRALQRLSERAGEMPYSDPMTGYAPP